MIIGFLKNLFAFRVEILWIILQSFRIRLSVKSVKRLIHL